MSFISRLRAASGLLFGKDIPNINAREGAPTNEMGYRPTPEDAIKYMHRLMWVDPDHRQAILDIRDMDRADGRVKRIHSRIARDTIKGGLIMQQSSPSEVLSREWDDFQRRLQLNRVTKLKSDALGLVKEGNLPMQWVLDSELNVVAGIRMPSETIIPNVSQNGRFLDVTKAYSQIDIMTGTVQANFALWQLTHERYDPDNFDDLGCYGRPFLDASRGVWRKLQMTEEDLVIRRRTRAPQRMSHVLEGASTDEIDKYRAEVEADQYEITTDFYANKKGGVTAVGGDSNLDQIADVVYLLDSFFAGTPLPKGMMGYTDGMARDILEDLKRDYYDEIDVLQDAQCFVYDCGFRLHLMLKGINPDAEEYKITTFERRTETMTQTTDRALKLKALGLPQGMVLEELGYNATIVQERKEWEAKNYDPYPGDESSNPTVKITPGNGRKDESALDITNR
ncbi:hypothetical protein LG200_05045 [Methylobacillus caricis]|uniref:hypothetical protein n=1 Tax=Methylobacillus caricis TaxID=1971611 RepID=UPI001CFFA078|nr:hypothetical protein [Methylobacillus caricis]MCB5187370.1 hypothetical protein [Methylobacillus caricis]